MNIFWFQIINYNFNKPGADIIKQYFFANEDFFRFSMASLRVYYIQKKIIDRKMIQLNSEDLKTKKKQLYRICYWVWQKNSYNQYYNEQMPKLA